MYVWVCVCVCVCVSYEFEYLRECKWMCVCVWIHLYILGVFPLSNPDHPQELVDIVSGIADHSTKYDQHIVHTQWAHDRVRLLFRGWHRLTHQSYVAIVPSVIVHESRPIGHT